jgi:hypothetical protein
MRVPFHGEVVSADASAGVAFALYLEGETTAYTLGATDHVEITDIDLTRDAQGAAAIVADTDAAGRRVWKAHLLAATGGVARTLATPHLCPMGVVPKLIADIGNVAAIIHGHIIQR